MTDDKFVYISLRLLIVITATMLTLTVASLGIYAITGLWKAIMTL